MLLKQSCLIQSHLLHYDFGLSPKLLFQLYSRGAPLCRFLWLYVTYSFAFHFVSLSAYVPDGCLEIRRGQVLLLPMSLVVDMTRRHR